MFGLFIILRISHFHIICNISLFSKCLTVLDFNLALALCHILRLYTEKLSQGKTLFLCALIITKIDKLIYLRYYSALTLKPLGIDIVVKSEMHGNCMHGIHSSCKAHSIERVHTSVLTVYWEEECIDIPRHALKHLCVIKRI